MTVILVSKEGDEFELAGEAIDAFENFRDKADEDKDNMIIELGDASTEAVQRIAKLLETVAMNYVPYIMESEATFSGMKDEDRKEVMRYFGATFKWDSIDFIHEMKHVVHYLGCSPLKILFRLIIDERKKKHSKKLF